MANPIRKALWIAGILTSFATMFVVVGPLNGCGTGSPPSASAPAPIQPVPVDGLTAAGETPSARVDTPTEFSTVTDTDVAEARLRLFSRGVTSSELAEACGHYVESGWEYPEAWDAAKSADRPRIAAVVAEVNGVAEEVALPGEWVRSITGSVDRSPAFWTEAELDAFDRAIVVRKSKLIEPLCAP